MPVTPNMSCSHHYESGQTIAACPSGPSSSAFLPRQFGEHGLERAQCLILFRCACHVSRDESADVAGYLLRLIERLPANVGKWAGVMARGTSSNIQDGVVALEHKPRTPIFSLGMIVLEYPKHAFPDKIINSRLRPRPCPVEVNHQH